MRIRKLELHGFKSFPDRTVFHFGSGISGVVGPNGCGKSNVMDAVKWCIGEQSPRSLRGRAMEDVVFGGTSQRAPMNTCEVSLTFVAGDTPFPGEWARFEEIQVTRRLVRGGGSDYYLNRQKVRLRDIQELFLDTGVGNQMYSVIEQGRVGRIIQASPEQRRALVEEAAGISRYKARRSETLERLARTEDNLERSRHVVQELEQRLEKIARQVDRAARYRRYRARAQQGAIFVALARYWQLLGDRRAMAARVREAEAERMRCEREQVRQERQLAREREQVEIQERVTGDLRDRQAELEASRRELESARMYQDRERRELEARQQRLVQEISGAEKALAEAEDARVQAEKELERSRERLAGVEAEYTSVQEEENALAEQLAEARRATERVRAEVGSHRDALVQARTRREGLEGQQERLKAEVRDLEQELEAAAGESHRLAELRTATRARSTVVTEELERARERVREARSTLSGVEEELSEARAAVRARQEEEAERNRVRVAKETRLATLEDLEERHVDLADRPRRILERVEGAFAVAEELEVDPERRRMLAAALGERVHAVGLPSTDTLESVVSGDDEGVAWLVVLDGVSSRGQEGGLATQVGGSDRALDALARLMGDVRSVPHLEAAWNEVAPGRACITPEGALVSPGGVVRVGTAEESGRQLLGRRQEQREARAALEEARARAEEACAAREQAESRASEVEQSRQEARCALNGLEKAAREVELEANGLSHRLAACEDAVRRQERTLATLRRDRGQEREQLAGIEEQKQRIEKEISQEESILEKAEARMRVSEDAARSLSSELEAMRSSLQQVREEVAALRERVRAGEQARRAAERNAALAEDRLKHAREEATRVERRKRELGRQEEQTEEGIARLAGEQEQVLGRLEAERKRLREERERVRARERRCETARSDSEAARRHHDAEGHRLDEIRTRLRSVRERTEEQEGVSLPALLDRVEKNGQVVLEHGLEEEGPLPVDLKRLPELENLAVTASDLDDNDRVKRWQGRTEEARRRMDRMGDVNLTAVEEYRDVHGRYQDLLGQREDLEETVREIRSALARINQTCRTRFRDAFEAVNHHFGELYGTLTSAGEAELILTSEEDLLETGIEILARPPGKRLQHLSLLSGGEMAVVGIAMLFALFRVKPSPFCLMDEVDAPLDESNASRFNLLLRRMAEVSQFIVITHNRKTMECADTLYGVTMPDPGVSGLVTVQVH